jgi:hypothetical protein
MSRDWYAKKLGGPVVPPVAPQPIPTGQQIPTGQIGQSFAPQGTAAEQAWHGNRGGREAGEVIRTYRGQVGSQNAVTACPNCGSPDGYIADMPAAGDVAAGGQVNARVLVDRSSARTPRCFYCGFHGGVTRGTPNDAAGYDGVTTKGEAVKARGANVATRIGDAMRVDRSLVNK